MRHESNPLWWKSGVVRCVVGMDMKKPFAMKSLAIHLCGALVGMEEAVTEVGTTEEAEVEDESIVMGENQLLQRYTIKKAQTLDRAQEAMKEPRLQFQGYL